MKYTAHSKDKTRFTKTVEGSGWIHGLIEKGMPWRNGFIERSKRTDKDELFNHVRFGDSEYRPYQLKLWEIAYNHDRPHQGLANQTPVSVYRRDYPLHAASRYTTQSLNTANDVEILADWYCSMFSYEKWHYNPTAGPGQRPVWTLRAPDGTLLEIMPKDDTTRADRTT